MKKPRSALATSLTLLGVLLPLVSPDAVRAHGLLGHIHVTGWAIENLPPGELRDFFEDPEVFRAALMGATFPDTGYIGDAAAREYAETAHWEPFIEDFIQHVRTTYGPTYTKEERLVVAFLLGCAAHGLQDELFDSTFMYEAEQRDGQSQDSLDPGTDGFLVLDGHHRLAPGVYPAEAFVPMTDLLTLFSTLTREVDEPTISLNAMIVTRGYVNGDGGLSIARQYGDMYRPVLPWASTHYLDAEVAGSHRAEILPTGRHMQALWDRLHDRFDEQDLVVHAWPEETRRLREAESDSVASWVTLVLGKGIEQDSATGSITDGAGTEHPFTLSYTRWGGTSRIVRFRPTEDFVPGGHYTVTLHPGATLVDGSTTTLSYTHDFQVACATPDDANCPVLPPVPDPSIDTPLVPDGGGGCAAGSGSTSALYAMLFLVAAVATRRRERAR